MANRVSTGIERVPDIIISDIMMPKRTVWKFAALKGDFRTNHIPIILLTAKTDVDSRIRGIGIRADASSA